MESIINNCKLTLAGTGEVTENNIIYNYTFKYLFITSDKC